MKHKIFEISDKDDRYSTPSRFRKILLHTMESKDSFLTIFKASARPGGVVGGGYIINLKKDTRHVLFCTNGFYSQVIDNLEK